MNIYDIAKKAGVSISTVSRVINNHPNVTQEKRDRVLTVLKESNYIPSAIAKSLVVKSTKTIGVLTLDIRHIHYANIAFIIEQSLSKKGYNVILCNTGDDQYEQEKYIRVLAEKQVDGVIMVGSVFSSQLIEACIDKYLSRTPVIMHNGTIKRHNVYSILSNETRGMKITIDYLISRGIREMVFVKEYDTWVAVEKQRIFKEMLQAAGLPFSNERVVRVSRGLEGGRQAVDIILKKGIPCSAFIGCDDITAVGVVQQLVVCGKKVPEDVSVIGFNNSTYSEVSVPQLTVVDNKMEAVGLGLARLLVDVLTGVDVPAVTSLQPTLIIRGSA